MIAWLTDAAVSVVPLLCSGALIVLLVQAFADVFIPTKIRTFTGTPTIGRDVTVPRAIAIPTKTRRDRAATTSQEIP